MKARVKFSKTGSMRFIGHLDIMRYFQKALRRADIKTGYSKGFSPHQLISFTSPLGVGLSSEAEYFDIVLEEAGTPQELAGRLNAVMNDEIQVRGFTFVKDGTKPSMAALSACDYLIAVRPDKESPFSDSTFTMTQVNGFCSQEKIEIVKKTKKSEKTIDIKPHIYHMAVNAADFEKMTGINCEETCINEGCNPVIYCTLASGSVVNIKPELVLEALCSYAGMEYDKSAYQVHRLEMYATDGGKFVPMSEYGAETGL